MTDEYLKFWRGTSEPDAHELRMNFHPLCCLVSSRVTWLRQAWERERGRLLFFSATLFTLLRESERTPTIEKSYLLCPYEARSWKWNCAKGRAIINKSRGWTNVSTTSIETGIDKWFRGGGERCSIRVIWICLGYGFLVLSRNRDVWSWVETRRKKQVNFIPTFLNIPFLLIILISIEWI